jgi:hypothetical protein
VLDRGYSTAGGRIRPIGWRGQVTLSVTPYSPEVPLEMVVIAYCVEDGE